MTRLVRRLGAKLIVAGLGLGLGCGEYLGPDRGDPAQYAFATDVGYACGRWAPSRPAAEYGLFDIYWGRSNGEAEDDGPRPDHIRRVIEAGGTVVARYHVIMVRAVMPTAAVPALGAEVVRGVKDPSRMELGIFVGFRFVPDPGVVTSRGGTVTQVYDAFPVLAATVPDAVIPSIRREPLVTFVEGEGVFCAL